MAREDRSPSLGRLFGRSQDGLEVWRLFFAGDDGNFDPFKACRFKPPLQVAFGETEPRITVKLASLLELMLQKIEDHDLATAAKDSKSRVDGVRRGLGVVQGLAEHDEIDGLRIDGW